MSYASKHDTKSVWSSGSVEESCILLNFVTPKLVAWKEDSIYLFLIIYPPDINLSCTCLHILQFAGLWGSFARHGNHGAHCGSCYWSIAQKGHGRSKEPIENRSAYFSDEGCEHCHPCFWWNAGSFASWWSSF